MKKRIPESKNEDEEREFWASHDATDYMNLAQAKKTILPGLRVSVKAISFTDDCMKLSLGSGRTISVPLTWYPRLLVATSNERANHEMIGEGEGIHWPDLDEDISVAGILAGRRSGESQKSLRKWFDQRAGR